ncbi:MAG: extracellular solute-binding protein [Lachnospiraceae bacterium]|nr:extracellular solute-binding protein [Lachnospiraceae bacterium]
MKRRYYRMMEASFIFRIAILLMVIFTIAGSMTGCSSEEQHADTAASSGSTSSQEEVPVLRIFDKNMTGQKFDDPVAEAIMEKTGVRIEVMDATGTPTKALELMKINGTYPDIILMEQGEMVNQFIESGVFLPLDDLIEDYGYNIAEMYGEILEKSRYEDGQVYWLANWYGKDTDASAGVLMRKDYLIELVGRERAESTEPFTVTEYTELLRAFKKKHPEINGTASIPLDLDADAESYTMTMKGIFGMKTYGEDEQGNLTYLPVSERYREVLLYLNSLYTEELLCREWMIDRTEKWKEELRSGAVFSTWCSYWDTDDVNEVLKQEYGEDAQFFSYKVVADDLDETETTYNGRNSLGWDAIGITANCSDPETAMKVLNFLAGEEGQYLLLWGIEGDTWTMEQGIHVPNGEFLESWSTGSAAMEQTTGIRRWKWTIKNGNGSDGTPYDLTTKYSPSELVIFANERILESDYWDTAEYSGLEPSLQSDLGLVWQKIEAGYSEYFPRIVCADDQQEALQLFNEMKTFMEELGLSDCESYITEQYKERLSDWDQE